MSPELSALYRLFLRATSASVLHHPTATKNLRKLWRPSFVEMARIEVEKKKTRHKESLHVLEAKMARCNERIDNTLLMLLSSATSRGLSHRVTRNLGFLTDAHNKSHLPRAGGIWNPSLPAHSTIYTPTKSAQMDKKEKLSLHREVVDAGVLHTLDEIIRLAEGRSGVTLGRLPPALKRTYGHDDIQ